MRALLSRDVRRRLRRLLQNVPAAGQVDFGDLRRTSPLDRDFGYGRGLPVDRFYIESFLAQHAIDIQGRVLEIGENIYTRRFGAGRVVRSDVLDIAEGNPAASLVGDLARADHVASGIFDCVILTQTLHLIYEYRAALATVHRILKPCGVLLATFPGITQVYSRQGGDTCYWSFTAWSAERLFAEVFPPQGVAVETRGNVLAAISFLHGVAAEELRSEELEHQDPSVQILITVRAVKAG